MEPYYKGAWELVLSLIGGYLALKNLGKMRRRDAFLFLVIAVIIGFAAAPAAVAFAVHAGWIAADQGDSVRPFAILLASSASLRAVSLMYTLLAKAKKIRLPGEGP